MWQFLFDFNMSAHTGQGFGRTLIRKITGLIIRRMAKIGLDPLIRARIHGTELILPITHMLPRYVASYPYYDTALPALARFLVDRLAQDGRLSVIDVGANVGDSTALIASACGHERVRLTCIEADKAYISLLRKNTKGLAVTIYEAIAGAESTEVDAAMARSGGTSSVVPGDGTKHRSIRLDDLAEIGGTNLIKIDTDGFEFEVLRGLSGTIARESPLIFFEYAPAYLHDFGHVEPIVVLDFLISAGYTHATVWDHTGYPMMTTELSSDFAKDLTSYCLVKPGFYVDILVSNDRALLRDFHEIDLARYGHAAGPAKHRTAWI